MQSRGPPVGIAGRTSPKLPMFVRVDVGGALGSVDEPEGRELPSTRCAGDDKTGIIVRLISRRLHGGGGHQSEVGPPMTTHVASPTRG